MSRLDAVPVVRVQDATGSHIEPACDDSWPEAIKLAWKAAVTEFDSGVPIKVHRYPSGYYCLQVGAAGGQSSIGGCTFDSAWAMLTGISIGAKQVRRSEPEENHPHDR